MFESKRVWEFYNDSKISFILAMATVREQLLKATDKLFRQTIVIRKRLDTYNSFGEAIGTDDTVFQDFTLLGLFIPKKQKFESTKSGEADWADAYCQFNTINLEEIGLLVNNVIQITEDALLVFNNQIYEIVGIIPVAPDFFTDNNTFVLYQFFLRK